MDPTATITPTPTLTLATDPDRPGAACDAAIRRPGRFAAALGAFLRAVGPAARPIVTIAADAWILEGLAADRSAYARLSVPIDEFNESANFWHGTTGVAVPQTIFETLGGIGDAMPLRLRVGGPAEGSFRGKEAEPPGWLRGFAAMMAATSLPMRRVPVDRGGLFGLIAALGPSRAVRAGRSIGVGWRPGRPAEAVARPGGRPVALHARPADGAGVVRVAVGSVLASLAGLIPRVDGGDLFLLGPGLPSGWSVRLGGIGLFLGVPAGTADGRLGALGLDSIEPPIEPGRFLANQVVATFRVHPVQARAEVAARARASEPEVAAVLLRLAELGRILPEPEAGRFRWRAAWVDSANLLDDPEPAEATAARAIARTTSVQVARVEPLPAGKGRRLEGTVLDRPATLELDADGWIRRGRCTCSHHEGSGLRRGPCRHLLSLQARATFRPGPAPADLAAWFADFPAPMVGGAPGSA